MSYRVQTKIEVINEQGQVVNAQGQTLDQIQRELSEWPLVTCDKSSKEFATAELAGEYLESLHDVIKLYL